ncbi:mediator of RNA polymerase II transcription subunit 14 [Aspergillus novoparasiticus]|uniref:Mediator of RNA polymerase II transcription subunit 14 n=1 Tax=Aspergillus novoparasiticus TaxID=986946 RepID=A0A5N6ED63_9EURO|nr:mediator of RNA polymerase II transcription subunit 14 [Aspergillus novoparasiticus]
MPGVVMDNTKIGGAGQGSAIHDSRNGMPSLTPNINRTSAFGDSHAGRVHINGMTKNAVDPSQAEDASTVNIISTKSMELPGLPHITQGFFPFSKLISRSVQQSWNDLSDLITEMADIKVSPQEQNSLQLPASGKSFGNQSPENIRKKARILDFAHAKRAEFIKLLVLSQWSRQAADVSKLIDLQNFIRTRHQAYMGALQGIGNMKRDLVQAQVANPDLTTALEVLSKGKVSSMSDLGYKPPRSLTGKDTLKRLQKINRIISVRLALYDSVPRAFHSYSIHDGRVTFVVPNEFELDLSIGQEDESSQLYFVDIRFLFNPSSPILKGRIFNEFDVKVNDALRNDGLSGCFDLLHSLVLTNKINILFKQAMELARGLWYDVLRVELLHRTLVVHYWTQKAGAKSWLEIGIKSGRICGENDSYSHPNLGLRWIRDGQEVDSEEIEFNTESLSMECILRSVIALHISHILSSAYYIISESLLYSAGRLSLQAQLARTEPGDCGLTIQLTESRHLSVSIEPMSGASIISATPSAQERLDNDRSSDKSSAEHIVARVARLRCMAAIDEIESNVKMLGFETVNPRSLKIDFRRMFPSNVLRFSFFWHHLWERNWIVAATSSMDGDNWWVVQLQKTTTTESHSVFDASTHISSTLRSAQAISGSFFHVSQNIGYPSFADLGHYLSGILAVHTNARYLADLQSVDFYPPLQRLVIEPNLQVPEIFMRYEAANIPEAFRIALPSGLKSRARTKGTIRLAFHGIDPCKKVATIVAYGNLLIPIKAFSALNSTWDHSLVFQKRGTGFAIRLLAPPGRPVIPKLIENLQRLDCVLSIFECLQRKKMEPRSLSLSHVTFAYGPEKDLLATLNIETSMPPSSMELDPIFLASRTKSLFHLRLGLSFEFPNPHRRIQKSIESTLNHSTTDAVLDTVAELLLLTLPLMRALDQILMNPSNKQTLRVQVIVRNAKTFQIHYPGQSFRFQLVATHHLGHMVWILKELSSPKEGSSQDQLKLKLRERLYNSKGDGWRGLGNGVVAETGKVGNLLTELDKCFEASSTPGLTPEVKANGSKSFSQQSTAENGNLDGTLSESATLIPAPNATSTRHKTGDTTQNADIIMID